jgi:hypothetical protein
VIPLPIVFLAGCECRMAIRTAAEVNNWAKSVFNDDDWYLATSFGLAKSIITDTGTEKQQDYKAMLKLPSSIEAGAKKLIFKSEGWGQLPVNIKPASATTEKEIVAALLIELRDRLALELCTEPSFERGFRQPKSAKTKVEFLVIGSSNASKTAKGLNNQGYSSTVVYSEGWRATTTGVNMLLSQVKELLANYTCDTVVFQLTDNSIFFGKTEEGALMPAMKGPDGKFHLNGDLEVAGRTRQFEILNLLKPVLDLVKDVPAIFISPMPRYVACGCCDEHDHVANRFQRGFKDEIMAKLAEVKANTKNFMFMNHYHNITVMDPAVDMRGVPEDNIWGTDPIRPKESFYNTLAKSVAVLVELAKRKRPADGPPEEPNARRGCPAPSNLPDGMPDIRGRGNTRGRAHPEVGRHAVGDRQHGGYGGRNGRHMRGSGRAYYGYQSRGRN